MWYLLRSHSYTETLRPISRLLIHLTREGRIEGEGERRGGNKNPPPPRYPVDAVNAGVAVIFEDKKDKPSPFLSFNVYVHRRGSVSQINAIKLYQLIMYQLNNISSCPIPSQQFAYVVRTELTNN